MSFEDEHPTPARQINASKMDVIDSALKAFAFHLQQLDNTGFSIASVHLNAAIERLNTENIALTKEFKI